MSHFVGGTQVPRSLVDTDTALIGPEGMFPDRKFTLDGYLAGRIGEVVAVYIFDLNLASGPGHDARSRDGRNVEIEPTLSRGVEIRHEADDLVFSIYQKAVQSAPS